mmetsp:Transcript_23592/g.33857  ORF Transcript_23592/g.33857 Transcript_23592/m.33857 type:complete len:155 (-) Transcript_23592:69-533(-)
MKYNSRSRTIKDPIKVAHYQCNWEQRDHHPLVKMKSDEIKKHSARTKRALVDGSGEVMIVGISGREEKQQKIHDGKDEVRKNALRIISTTREGSFLKTGRHRNTEELIEKQLIAAERIEVQRRRTVGAAKLASLVRIFIAKVKRIQIQQELRNT